MSYLKEPPTSPRNAGRPPDEIDGLLQAFFRAEVPNPWPVLRPPAAAGTPAAVAKVGRTWVMMRSRLALAASICLLVIGCWFLSGLANERFLPSGTLPDGTAGRGIGGKYMLLKEEPEEIIDINEVKYKLREKVLQPVKPVGGNVKPDGPATHQYEMEPIPKSGEK